LDDFRIECDERARSVAVLSRYRLQFDSKPETLALRDAIHGATPVLVAGDDELLEAVYTSESRDPVDAENVLLYNVGVGGFARAARAGLRFERVVGRHPSGAAHHHAYGIAPLASGSHLWRPRRMALEVRGVVIPRLQEGSSPDELWLALRRALPAVDSPVMGRFGLELAIRLSTEDTVHPAAVVKPLLDGVVCAMQTHDGRDLIEASTRLARRLGLPREEAERLLMNRDCAWLGFRRLLWTRAEGIQWNPGDDLCMTCTLRVTRGTETLWRLDARLFEVEPLSGSFAAPGTSRR
jgi:hypothetical protein